MRAAALSYPSTLTKSGCIDLARRVFAGREVPGVQAGAASSRQRRAMWRLPYGGMAPPELRGLCPVIRGDVSSRNASQEQADLGTARQVSGYVLVKDGQLGRF
jgi:hypothetical protein